MGTNFTHYRTFYEYHTRGDGERTYPGISEEDWKTPETFYEASVRLLGAAGLATKEASIRISNDFKNAGRQYFNECRWFLAHRPHYRLYPSILDALLNITIDIDAGLLRFPFSTFKINFPENHYRENENSPYCRGLLVGGRRTGDPCPNSWEELAKQAFTSNAGYVGDDPSYLSIEADFGDETLTYPGFGLGKLKHCCKPFNTLDLIPGRTIAQAIDGSAHIMQTEIGYLPSAECWANLVRIAAGVCFFAINNHEIISSDIPAKLLKKLLQAKKDKARGRIKKLNSQIGSHRFSFSVGKEIDVLDRSGQASGDNSDSHRELHHSHIRTGHMKWQPHGPKNSQRKLIFVAPTVIRPDLPMNPNATPRGVGK